MIEVKKYNAESQLAWNEFLDRSKNGTFLFNRGYMDYHSDRFVDHSLMIYHKNKLVALFPANIKDCTLISHGGLTYGGLITTNKISTSLVLRIFNELKGYCTENGINKIIYKTIPHIYHQMPAEEDLYALFINNAVLIKREISSTIELTNFKIGNNRRNGARKAESAGLVIERCGNIDDFWNLVDSRLYEKYGVSAVHSADEMKLLMNRFSDNIKLFCAKSNDRIVGGALLYETETLVHTQYLSTNEEGREKRALDLIITYLVNKYYKEKKYFDFGISTEQGGLSLNESLIKQKEEYGASAVNYDTYELNCAA